MVVTGENLIPCQFFNHTPHMDWPSLKDAVRCQINLNYKRFSKNESLNMLAKASRSGLVQRLRGLMQCRTPKTASKEAGPTVQSTFLLHHKDKSIRVMR